MKYMEVLKSNKLFENMSEGEISKVLSCLQATTRSYLKNQTIIAEGEKAKDICIVLSGEVLIIKDDYLGNRTILASIGKGAIFAEAFACAETAEIPVSAICSDNSEIMFIDCKRLITACPEACCYHNTLIANLLKAVARKNLTLNSKIDVISKRTTREKLLTYLSAQSKQSGSNEFTIPFDRQGLADYICAERSAVSAELGKMRRERIIDFNKNRFKLL